jgi:hypothetical protein
MRRSTHHTSWAAAFAVAAELSRRCYDVAFTVGNTPRYDLFCTGPSNTAFKIQVKGISNAAAFWVQYQFFSTQTEEDLFLVVVLVPRRIKDGGFRYFILSHHEAKEAFAKLPTHKKDGRKYDPNESGLTWGSITPYENAWPTLPDSG